VYRNGRRRRHARGHVVGCGPALPVGGVLDGVLVTGSVLYWHETTA
jgi:hypothetical protein